MLELISGVFKEVFYSVGVFALIGMALHCFFRRSAAAWWGIFFALFAIAWRIGGRINSSRYAAVLIILTILFSASAIDIVREKIAECFSRRRWLQVVVVGLLFGGLLIPPLVKCFRYDGKLAFKQLIPHLRKVAAEKPAGAPIYVRHDANRLKFFSGVELEPYPESLRLDKDPNGYWEPFFEKRRYCLSPIYLLIGDSDSAPIDGFAWRKKLADRLKLIVRIYTYRRKKRRMGIYLYVPEVFSPGSVRLGKELFTNGSCEKVMSDAAARKLIAEWAKKKAFYRDQKLRLPSWPMLISGRAGIPDKAMTEVSLVSDGALDGNYSLRFGPCGGGGVYLERVVPADAYVLSFLVRGKPGAIFAVSTYNYSKNKPMKPGVSRIVILPDDKVHRIVLPFPHPECDEMLFLLLPPQSELWVDDLSLRTWITEPPKAGPKTKK